MANYNPYYPSGYQPVMPYYAAPQSTSPTQSIVWVQGERQAIEYPVAPNGAVALWDSASPSIYLKTADASGRPSLKAYDLVERTQTRENAQSSQTSVDTSNELSFVREALCAIQSDLREMKSALGGKKDEQSVL